MEDQKLENLLNLALSVPEDMRARSQELEIGYHKAVSYTHLDVYKRQPLGQAQRGEQEGRIERTAEKRLGERTEKRGSRRRITAI